jgi:hypothetical protein
MKDTDFGWLCVATLHIYLSLSGLHGTREYRKLKHLPPYAKEMFERDVRTGNLNFGLERLKIGAIIEGVKLPAPVLLVTASELVDPPRTRAKQLRALDLAVSLLPILYHKPGRPKCPETEAVLADAGLLRRVGASWREVTEVLRRRGIDYEPGSLARMCRRAKNKPPPRT